MTWNYFCTSHGKGPVDGVGATVKRIVAEIVKSRKCSVQCAVELIEAAQHSTPKITLLLGNVITGLFEGIDNAPQVAGIKDLHYVKALSTGICEQQEITPNAQAQAGCVFAINDYVIFNYDGDLYPGFILAIKGSMATIKSMKKTCVTLWKWPPRDDIFDYSISCIVKRINSPISKGTGSRLNSYRVPELEC